MAFSMNGALTTGTLDGANIEIRDAVGHENFFPFGSNAEQVAELKPHHRPRDFYASNATIREVLESVESGAFANGDRRLFAPLLDNLRESDPFLVLADFQSYLDAQARVGDLWLDRKAWTRQSILTVARMGRFSSDRSIRDYTRSIWHVDGTSA